MKEIDRIANEIGDVLVINPDSVNLSQVAGGWLADVYSGATLESEVMPNPIQAMENLLKKAKRQKVS